MAEVNPYVAPQTSIAWAPYTTEEVRKLRGIGGWLILVSIDLGLSVVASLFTLLALGNMMNRLSLLTNSSLPNYDPLLLRSLALEGIQSIVILVIAIWALALMFQFSRHTCIVMIAFYVLKLIAALADFALARQLQDTVQASDALIPAVHAGIAFVLGVPYFVFSKRVKATFTR